MAGVRRVSADFINHVMNNGIVRQRHIPDEADAPLFNHHRGARTPSFSDGVRVFSDQSRGKAQGET